MGAKVIIRAPKTWGKTALSLVPCRRRTCPGVNGECISFPPIVPDQDNKDRELYEQDAQNFYSSQCLERARFRRAARGAGSSARRESPGKSASPREQCRASGAEP